LDQVSNTEPISIYINSDGGDTAALFQIYDTINLIKAPIQTICIGAAYSAGSVLLASGTPGLRYMYKSAQVMLHGIQFIFPLPHDTVDESKNKLNYYKRHNDDILKIVAKHTGQSLATVREDSASDNYMSAKEAVKYG